MRTPTCGCTPSGPYCPEGARLRAGYEAARDAHARGEMHWWDYYGPRYAYRDHVEPRVGTHTPRRRWPAGGTLSTLEALAEAAERDAGMDLHLRRGHTDPDTGEMVEPLRRD